MAFREYLEDLSAVGSILTLEPHPDDFLLMIAGSTFKLKSRHNGKVYVTTITDGGGAANTSEKDKLMAEARQQESEKADQILGVDNRTCLAYPSRDVETKATELYGEISKQIRLHKPDITVTTYDPSVDSINGSAHPVHKWMCENLPHRAFQANEPIRQKEWGIPHKTRVWLGENYRTKISFPAYPNLFINISETLEAKLQAFSTQRTQIPNLGGDKLYEILKRENLTEEQAYDETGIYLKPEIEKEVLNWLLTKIEKQAEKRGRQCNVKYAEAFLERIIHPELVPRQVIINTVH